MAILLAALTSVFYGVFDFAGGMATRRASAFVVAFWSDFMGLVLSSLIAFVYHLVFGSGVTLSDLAWGALSGVAAVAGVVAYFEGLAKGQVAVVAPASAITVSLIPFKCASLAAAGILVKTREVSLGLPRKSLLLALAAGGSVLANLTYLLAVRIGPLGLVAVASSLYPAVVAVMAFLVYREKAPPQRVAGLLLSLVALSLIAL